MSLSFVSGYILGPMRRVMRMTALILGAMALAASGHAQFAGAPKERPKPEPQKNYPKLDFNSSDFIRIKVGRIKEQYFVGEPVVVPLTISNHTRFAIALTTNLAPRSNLKVLIRPSDRPSRPYYGAYPVGTFPTVTYDILPLGEVNENALLWADLIEGSGLVFPYPGKYIVEMTLQVAVQGNQVVNTLQVKPFEVNVVATPPELAPMIDLLGQHKLFELLHRKVVSEQELDTLRRIVKDFPTNAITPYCYLAIANHLAVDFDSKPTKAKQDEILIAYQIAAKSYSAYRFSTYLTLISFMDKVEMTHAATETFKELLREMPLDWHGKIGNTDLAQKYLHNSLEILPVRDWDLLQ